MKFLFDVAFKDGKLSFAFLVLRIGIGILMLVHGLPKMGSIFSNEPIQFPPVFGMSSEMSLGLTIFSEVVCSLLLIIGFGTRLAAVPLIITMLVAVLYIHGSDTFAKQEMGIHYLLAYLVLLITGPGKYSIDYMVSNRHQINQTGFYSRL